MERFRSSIAEDNRRDVLVDASQTEDANSRGGGGGIQP